MFIHDVAYGTVCAVSSVHLTLSTLWPAGHNENVDEDVQVGNHHCDEFLIFFFN